MRFSPYHLLRYLPRNLLSYFLGRLAQIPLPQPFAHVLVSTFARLVRADLSEVAEPIEYYHSVSQFFTRALRPGLRPIESEVVSPVDGTLRDYGIIGERIEHVKGKGYSLTELLHDESYAQRFQGGYYWNLYLSPQNYHRVHSPVRGQVVAARYIPGTLWPVNEWSLTHIPKLFAVNERMVTYIQSSFGLVAVVMVGAMNVGKITVSYDSLLSNQLLRTPIDIPRLYDPPREIAAGDPVGIFHLGSTVVMLLEPQGEFHQLKKFVPYSPLCYGESFLAGGGNSIDDIATVASGKGHQS